MSEYYYNFIVIKKPASLCSNHKRRPFRTAFMILLFTCKRITARRSSFS